MKPTQIFTLFTLAAAASAKAVFKVTYESGNVTDGLPTSGSKRLLCPGIEPGLATAKDAIAIVSPGAHGTKYAVGNKVTVDDPAYVGGGFPRSEFGFAGFPGAIYKDGERGEYSFSMLIKDLVPSVKGDRDAPMEDVLWQFKHHGGGHDLHLALVGTNLVLGWGGNVYKEVIIDDVMPYVNKWMDFRFDVLWRSDNTGRFTLDFKLPGECRFGHTVTKEDLQTYVLASPDGTPWTGTGSIQYGVYRHSANSSAGDTKTLIVYHDEITAINYNATASS